MRFNRREFLKTGAGLTALSLGLTGQRLSAIAPATPKKVLFIFQRGGWDGINAVIPHGDLEYNTTNRPTLYVPEGNGYDLGNGFAVLHPRLEPLMEIFNSGTLALIHRVGYPDQSRSHFDSQHWWTNGDPLNRDNDTGIFNRVIDRCLDVSNNPFPAASLTSEVIDTDALAGPATVANFSDPRDFTFQGGAAKVAKILGNEPNPDGTGGSGLLGYYGGPQDAPGKILRDRVYDAGLVMASTIDILGDVDPATYVPENGAAYSAAGLSRTLRIAAQLFKETSVQILGVDMGGWDHHATQQPLFDGLAFELSLAMRAFYRDMQSQWDDMVVITLSEFGRTSIENGSRGTDHAEATVMMVGGGAVNGGVYNCDSTTWQNGDLFSTPNGRYLARRTDFRAVLGEVLEQQFCNSPRDLDFVFPGYSDLAQNMPNEFASLGLFS